MRGLDHVDGVFPGLKWLTQGVIVSRCDFHTESGGCIKCTARNGTEKMTWFPIHSLMISIVILFLSSSAGAQKVEESKRMVTEHQLLHDKGKVVEELKRLMWLNSAIKGVHNAQQRDGVRSLLHTSQSKRKPMDQNSSSTSPASPKKLKAADAEEHFKW
ncbi:parathyroid hormone-like [Narcine bancroftii]|uniref:parathyroid hormone-like n=1 Tax=Narcine bancroftii TaxID=1343680 RepID=UPI003832001E